MIEHSILKYLASCGFSHLGELEGRGLCGIHPQIFTHAIAYGIDEEGNIEGRYCFTERIDAVIALSLWDGKGDPSGDWIKHKGQSGEYRNPKLPKNPREEK